MATRKIEVAITGDASSLERAFRRSGAAADSFGNRMGGRVAKGMKVAGLLAGGGLVLGLGAAAMGLAKAGRAAAEAEASNARLSAQLKTLGKDNAAVKGNIDKTVQSLSMMSGFDDEDLQDSFTTLARTTGSVSAAQKQLGLVADIARGRQISLSSAAQMVNRVNAGSITGLKRYGIAVDKNTTKEQALALLRQKFSGQAKAYGETAAGAQERLRVAMENTFEQVGVALTPLIIEFANFATTVLPKVAAAISQYLGAAIAWVKTNWPAIKPVLVGIFNGVVAVVVPTFRAIVTAIGAVVSFVRAHMPEIRAAFSAAFGWISTNVVPTVRTLATVVATTVRFMTRMWREHGNDIKAIVGPAFNTIATVIRNALNIVKGVIEVVLAVIRGDWGKAWSALKGVVRTALDSVVTIMMTLPRTMLAIAKIVGRELVEGIKSGFEGAVGGLKSFLEDKIHSVVSSLNPFSPVAHGGEVYIGRPLILGAIDGVRKTAPRFSRALSVALRQAVRDARGNLSSITGGLGDMLGTLAGSSSPEAKRLAAMRAEDAKEERRRRLAELNAAIASATTGEERAQAERDLADYNRQYEEEQLEQTIADRQEAYRNDLANLTELFNQGRLSAKEFRKALRTLIGGQSGEELGAAFAGEFSRQIDAVFAQVGALSRYGGVGPGGPDVSTPSDLERRERNYRKRLAKWKREKAKHEGDEEWLSKHPRPVMMALGGIATRAIVAGEAGPEAILPLSSGRARAMLSSALSDARGARGGTTIVNVHVNGNEFSARDFARKLKPELNRLVGFGQV